jgi:serine/threonine-protein kinase 24/25/MST4
MDTEDDDDIKDYRREISLLAKCKSKWITKYYKSIVANTKLWVIMEYATGGSVRNILKSGVIPELTVAVITNQVVQALQYLHKTAKIIHRDIKCANILIYTGGMVKLCDFGVACETFIKSKRNSFVGTAYWMPPEIIKHKEYGFKADVWSLGISIIEMITGNPPFSDLNPQRAIFLIPKSKAPKISGDFSDDLKEFISMCLKEDGADVFFN